ncbi:MAG: hypothetical protein Q8Q02_11005 [Nocardioides sp.]|nr:hypothetical protein [Nocardioides sp.]
MSLSAVRLALVAVAFHIVAAVVAVVVNLPAQFTTGGPPKDDVGWDVITTGTALSAPLPPVLGLLMGAWLASRSGRTRVVGLVLLLLTCVVMTIGWVGEHASGIPFEGTRYAIFLVLSVVGILVTIALVVAVVRELVRSVRSSR